MKSYESNFIFVMLLVIHLGCLLACFARSGRPVFKDPDRTNGRYDTGLTVENNLLLLALFLNFTVFFSLFVFYTDERVSGLKTLFAFELTWPCIGLWLLCLDTVASCVVIYALYRINHISIMLPLAAPGLLYAVCVPSGIFASVHRVENLFGPTLSLVAVYLVAASMVAAALLRMQAGENQLEARAPDDDLIFENGDDTSWYDFEFPPTARSAAASRRKNASAPGTAGALRSCKAPGCRTPFSKAFSSPWAAPGRCPPPIQ
ncbi:MAG: hypothetical protein IJ523_04925 [Succinivibrionaceae bacterium]|nr:hypothetical protein [Succinivibrionaceae bacterium]